MEAIGSIKRIALAILLASAVQPGHASLIEVRVTGTVLGDVFFTPLTGQLNDSHAGKKISARLIYDTARITSFTRQLCEGGTGGQGGTTIDEHGQFIRQASFSVGGLTYRPLFGSTIGEGIEVHDACARLAPAKDQFTIGYVNIVPPDHPLPLVEEFQIGAHVEDFIANFTNGIEPDQAFSWRAAPGMDRWLRQGWFDYGIALGDDFSNPGDPSYCPRAIICISGNYAVDSLTVTRLPAPSTFALFGLGLIGLGLVKRRALHARDD